MKIAYFGTPSFSATLLEKLILDKSLGIEISLVVTQPDKPVGRKMVMTPSPVKLMAQKYKISIVESLDTLHATRYTLHEVDFALVYAYGFKQLIPLDLLKAPKMQLFVNIHPSLLPLYRGSSPIAYPILLGENKTGVTLFVMDEKMDHGPIIAQEEIPITLTDVRSDMEKKLTDLGFEMVKKFLNSLIRESVNSLILKPQLHKQATRAPYMTKQDGFIPLSVLQKALKNEPLTIAELPQIIQKYLSRHHYEGFVETGHAPSLLQQQSGLIIYNFWRGMYPWPGIWTLIEGEPPRLDTKPPRLRSEAGKPRGLNMGTSGVKLAGKRLKIIDMEYHVETGHAPSLRIKTLQLEGKSPVDFPTFQKAYNIF